jgi:hypothetical protein
MGLHGTESNLGERLDAYQREARAIKRKLENGVPEEKRDKIESRLNDIKFRLIPNLVRKIF